MVKYIIKRLLLSLLILFGVSVLIYGLIRMLPQDYVELTAEEHLTNINRILDLLDADDDVQEVFHNWDE